VPHTLLLADDSVTIQRVIELTFAEEDVQVVAVSDGDQAIERLESAPPDIVLADIGMPGRHGYEVARYVRQTPKLAHIPVVLLTGAFEPVDQAKATEVGCDGVLAKPFEPQLVIGRVKDLLARRRPAADGVTGASSAPSQEPWAPAPIPATAASVPASEQAAPISLDSYFDRLDAAFTNVSAVPAATPGPPPAPAATPPVADEIDWFGAAKTETPAASPDLEMPAPSAMDERPDLPLTPFAPPVPESKAAVGAPDIAPNEPPVTAPSPVAEVPAPAAAAPVVQTAAQPGDVGAAPVAQPPVPIHQIPTLADAFAVLLAAEKGEAIPSWPADDIVEQVTKRILAQLSERIVRETVADIVNAVAERMIREEIDRIKSAIQ